MVTLTVKFNGVQEEVLEKIVAAGIAETKSEAVRMAVLNFAIKTGMFDDRAFLEHIRQTLSKEPLSPDAVLSEIEKVKHERVSRQQHRNTRSSGTGHQ